MDKSEINGEISAASHAQAPEPTLPSMMPTRTGGRAGRGGRGELPAVQALSLRNFEVARTTLMMMQPTRAESESHLRSRAVLPASARPRLTLNTSTALGRAAGPCCDVTGTQGSGIPAAIGSWLKHKRHLNLYPCKRQPDCSLRHARREVARLAGRALVFHKEGVHGAQYADSVFV